MEKNERNSEIQESEQLTAQKLHTRIYLENGYINDDQLDENGIFVDEYTDRSEYIYINNGLKETACRYIMSNSADGIMSLPTMKNFEVDVTKVEDIAHVNNINDLRPEDAIEVSGLVSDFHKDADQAETLSETFDTTKLLYAKVLRKSLECGHKIWLMNIEERLERNLSLILGSGAIMRIGPHKVYMGPPTLPVALSPQDVVSGIFTDDGRFGDMKRAYLKEALNGVSEKCIELPLVKLLRHNGVNTKMDYEF